MTTLKKLLTIWSKGGQEIDVGSLFDNSDPNNPLLKVSGSQSAGLVFEKALPLATEDGQASLPDRGWWSACVDQYGIVHAVYRAGGSLDYEATDRIYYVTSTDSGQTWSDPTLIASATADGYPGDPVISCPLGAEDRLYITFVRSGTGANLGTYFLTAASTAGGPRVWSSEYQIPAPSITANLAACSAKIVCVEGDLYVPVFQTPTLNKIVLLHATGLNPAAGDWEEHHVFDIAAGEASEPFLWLDSDSRLSMLVRMESQAPQYYKSNPGGYTVWTLETVNLSGSTDFVLGRPYVWQIGPSLLMMAYRSNLDDYGYVTFSRNGTSWTKPLPLGLSVKGYGDMLVLKDRALFWTTSYGGPNSQSRIMQFRIDPLRLVEMVMGQELDCEVAERSGNLGASSSETVVEVIGPAVLDYIEFGANHNGVQLLVYRKDSLGTNKVIKSVSSDGSVTSDHVSGASFSAQDQVTGFFRAAIWGTNTFRIIAQRPIECPFGFLISVKNADVSAHNAAVTVGYRRLGI